jgi:hypothetical protein
VGVFSGGVCCVDLWICLRHTPLSFLCAPLFLSSLSLVTVDTPWPDCGRVLSLQGIAMTYRMKIEEELKEICNQVLVSLVSHPRLASPPLVHSLTLCSELCPASPLWRFQSLTTHHVTRDCDAGAPRWPLGPQGFDPREQGQLCYLSICLFLVHLR